ncbi:MAG TPA: GNAT family N-acetyltransferase [Thermoplasmata archaeon]|nr:GNAT family N-acetyltransferase [Thermoplasmata archaeon]
MTAGGLEFRPTLDRRWLEHDALAHPVRHAYALWDLAHSPERIRFVSAVDGEETVGYLLVWLGHPAAPVVHWVGDDLRLVGLAAHLPPRPLVAIVPPAFAEAAAAARGPGRAVALLGLVGRGSADPGPVSETVRRLEAADRASLRAWAAQQDDPVVAEYAGLDPARELVYGAFEGDRLEGVVRAAVRLPALWVLGGVYVTPAARGEGFGRALVETVLRAAAAAGADVALYVREDRTPARTLYASLGFAPADRRVWLDLGAGLVP